MGMFVVVAAVGRKAGAEGRNRNETEEKVSLSDLNALRRRIGVTDRSRVSGACHEFSDRKRKWPNIAFTRCWLSFVIGRLYVSHWLRLFRRVFETSLAENGIASHYAGTGLLKGAFFTASESSAAKSDTPKSDSASTAVSNGRGDWFRER